MSEESVERRLTTILAADVVGYIPLNVGGEDRGQLAPDFIFRHFVLPKLNASSTKTTSIVDGRPMGHECGEADQNGVTRITDFR